MSKVMVLPDVDDRTPNNPCVLLSKNMVLSLYNKAHGVKSGDKEYRFSVNDQIKKYISEKAIEEGWDEVIWYNNQCLLHVRLQLL